MRSLFATSQFAGFEPMTSAAMVITSPVAGHGFTPALVLKQVERITRNDHFVRSKKLIRFLQFTVDRVLEGRGAQLSEYEIGEMVYERRESFDPQTDAIVRNEARRLRSKLKEYYRGEGARDPLVIEYPLGSYAPVFRRAEDIPLDFLAHGGEMGFLTRSFPWATTSLGPIDSWPQSLRSAVRVCLESRQPGIIHWGLDLISIYSDAFIPLIGDAHPMLLGNSVNAFPDLWRTAGEIITGVMDTGEPVWQEDLLFFIERRSHAEERHLQASFSPVWDDSGDIGGVCCLFTDTTSRVIAERQLQTLVQVNARISDTRSPAEVCRAAADALHFDPQDVPFASIYLTDEVSKELRLCASVGIESGTPASPFVLRSDSEGIPGLAKAARSGKREILDAEDSCACLPRGPWRISPRSLAVIPLALPGRPNSSGVIVAGLNPYRKVDEEYRLFLEQIATSVAKAVAASSASEEQRKRSDTLAAFDRSKMEFFTAVSHEFRTPLTLMLGPVEEMLRHPGEPFAGKRKDIEIVHRNAQRLLKLVNSLLDFSRMEAGRAQAFYEPADLASYTAELASGFRSAIEHVGLRFTVDCPILDEPVYVDRDLWEKLLLNLLSNALKFTLSGEIGIALRQLGRKVELSVWDTGVGIPSHELGSIFEQFHRVEGALGRTAEGSGIGLALVREVAKLHGGSVRVDSKEGEGSQFTVSVPLGHSHLPPERVGTTRNRTATPALTELFVAEALGSAGNCDAPSTWHEKPLRRNRGTVLLVEDNADMRNYVCRILASDYEVYALSDGEAALTLLREVRPDLILTDVMMPRTNGMSLLRAIRLNPGTAALPVILLSGGATESARIHGLESGANDFLTKPFSAQELMARVATQIKLARLSRK